MVFSYYIYKYPYKLAWYISKLLKLNPELVFYCADPLDYEMFKPIAKYLPSIKVVAKNDKTRKYLKHEGVEYFRMPSFPKAVIMGRHMPYKFPVKSIVKVGFDHGLYQFKRWTAARNYNEFDVYFVSSEEQVKNANELGITKTKAVGYPKLDNAFNGVYNDDYLNTLSTKLNLSKDKKTILFTTTWDVAGLSAIDKWIDRIEGLSSDYNVLVTVHTWTKEKYKNQLRNMNKIYFLEELDVTPYLLIADVMVGDYSSIIGEFCAFDKPIITFKVPDSDRTIKEVQTLIRSISVQIENSEDLFEAIQKSLEYPNLKQPERQSANKKLFLALDGKAGERAARIINGFIRKEY